MLNVGSGFYCFLSNKNGKMILSNMEMEVVLMEYDIRSRASAMVFLTSVTGYTKDEIISIWEEDAQQDIEIFWGYGQDAVLSEDYRDMNIICFHILGSLDECREIKENGLRNLRYVLAENTILNRLLNKAGIVFDIPQSRLVFGQKVWNIDYNLIKGQLFFPEAQVEIARRINTDCCINAFLAHDNPCDYGDNICRRPEILKDLADLIPEAKSVEKFWRKKSTSYLVTALVHMDQIQLFSFIDYLSPASDSEDVMVLKGMIKLAFDRYYGIGTDDGLIIYMKDDAIIRPEQILTCEKIVIKKS